MEACLRRWIVVVMERALIDMLESKRLPPAEGLPTNSDARQRHNGFVDMPTLVDLPSSDPSPSRNLSLDERASRVRESLGRLADALDRVIIEQHFFRDRSLREIAVELGMEYTKLRRRFHQALATLGRALEDV
jgi:RNA polymerase sigma factor (sigma-70 family)